MNAADLARLELAKRAYKATQAGEAEVQTGVRRARLSLTRPKRRRSWFSKGLVFVVLAVGSLAYAKPNALGEIVEKVLPREDGAGKRGAGGRLAELAAPLEAATKLGRATLRRASPSSVIANPDADSRASANPDSGAAANPRAVANPSPVAAQAGSPASKQRSTSTDASAGSARASTARTNAALAAALADGSASSSNSAAKPAGPKTAVPTSSWGRVGQALADGNQSEALAALDQLSASGDERTRDKADLGRAQLLMSQGETTAACSLASSLTHRRAGSRIERQAQLLLKSCH